MNTTTASLSSAAGTERPTDDRHWPADARRVAKLLKALRHGSLTVQWPDDQVCAYGDPQGAVHASLHLRSWEPLTQALKSGDIGFAEAYIAGQWSTADLTQLLRLLLANRRSLDDLVYGHWLGRLYYRVRHLLQHNSRRNSARNIHAHYDLGNAFYEAMLGPTMVYSCGYWAQAATLDEAQQAKLDLVCKKLELRPGQTLLDVGCGFGSLLRHACIHYGVRGVGISVSQAQLEWARARSSGLPIEYRLQDYRRGKVRFDRVASIGMFEHVGPRNHVRFLTTLRRHLHEDGLLLLHTIGSLRSQRAGDPFLSRHVFPHAVLPSAAQLGQAIEGRFVLEDWHSFGADYDRTLLAWHAAFEAAWPSLRGRYGERFGRLWRYYLLTCAGSFRARRNQLWQLVLSRRGVPGGYRSIR